MKQGTKMKRNLDNEKEERQKKRNLKKKII